MRQQQHQTRQPPPFVFGAANELVENDLCGRRLVGADTAVEQLFFAGGSVETPALRVLDQRDREGPVVRSHQKLGLVFPMELDVVTFGRCGDEPRALGRVSDRIARAELRDFWAQDRLQWLGS